MKKVILRIGGMSCSACSNGLEKYLNKQPKIKEAKVNLVLKTANIIYNDDLDISEIEQYIKDAGFESLGDENYLLQKEEETITPLIIYGVLGFVLMYISMAHMLNLPIIEIFNPSKFPYIYSITLLIMTIPFLIYGFEIITSGIKKLIHLMPNMDTLVTLGIISSFLYSLFSVIMVFLGNNSFIHTMYFESTAFVIYFIKLGKYIDKKSKNKTKDAITGLVQITPHVARIKDKEHYKEVTIDEIKLNDILIGLPGDKIAVDGEIVKGTTHIDESFISGESLPILKKEGDKVIAGSINYEGPIEYKAERIGKDSTISEIVRLVVEATNSKIPISRIADKICGYFVPIVLSLALITFLINIFMSDFSSAIVKFITVLVVACPCSLGLATPLAMVIAIGNTAKKGILIKNSEILESINKVNIVVFDKTGTLTNGSLSINKINNHCDLDDKELLNILGSIEKNSTHPIAKGIITYLKENKITTSYDFTTEDLSGFGVKAKDDKTIYYACNSSLLKKLDIINSYEKEELAMAEDGNSIIYLVKNNKVLATFGLKDTIRKESKKLVNELKKNSLEVIMLSGDNKKKEKKIAKELNIYNVVAEVKPKEKTAFINDLITKGNNVIMVGDGINDAPSLSSATIGISLKGATDIATSSADVIIVNNLLKILDLFKISKKTLRNIKQNLFWAFIYNIIMIPISMGLIKNVHINPMFACLMMILSSLTVTINALRLKR